MMPMSSHTQRNADEQRRIERIYLAREIAGKDSSHDATLPDVKHRKAIYRKAVADTVASFTSRGIAELRFLDVGCGAGEYLNLLLDEGATPANLTGTDLRSGSIEAARTRLPEGPTWHVGFLDDLAISEPYDMVSTSTVFSSVLDDDLRRDLADDMWARTAPGGVVFVWDFRFNNPSNADVRKVTKNELLSLFSEGERAYTPLALAPPLARLAARVSPALLPPLNRFSALRSHAVFTARKPR